LTTSLKIDNLAKFPYINFKLQLRCNSQNAITGDIKSLQEWNVTTWTVLQSNKKKYQHTYSSSVAGIWYQGKPWLASCEHV